MDKRFPIQGGLSVTWAAAERAYDAYATKFGRRQSLERLAERGGFGVKEFAWLYLGARDQPPGHGQGMNVSESDLGRALLAGEVCTAKHEKNLADAEERIEELERALATADERARRLNEISGRWKDRARQAEIRAAGADARAKWFEEAECLCTKEFERMHERWEKAQSGRDAATTEVKHLQQKLAEKEQHRLGAIKEQRRLFTEVQKLRVSLRGEELTCGSCVYCIVREDDPNEMIWCKVKNDETSSRSRPSVGWSTKPGKSMPKRPSLPSSRTNRHRPRKPRPIRRRQPRLTRHRQRMPQLRQRRQGP